MSELFLLSKAQMARISPHFPLSHGNPRVDDSRVVSGIVYVIRIGLQWKDAPKGYGPHKTLYNRFIRWSGLGVDLRPNYDPVWSRISASLLRSQMLFQLRPELPPLKPMAGWMRHRDCSAENSNSE